MYDEDMFWELINHLEKKYDAIVSTCWFYNCNYEGLIYIGLCDKPILMSFCTNQLFDIYEREGYDKLCEIVDTNIERVIRRFDSY